MRQEKTNSNSSKLQQECEEIETDEQNKMTESGPDDLALTENVLPEVSSTKLNFSCSFCDNTFKIEDWGLGISDWGLRIKKNNINKETENLGK